MSKEDLEGFEYAEDLVPASVRAWTELLRSLGVDEPAPGQIEAFVEAWKDVAPGATHFMPTKDLKKLLLAMEPPLGFLGVDLKGNASLVTEKLKSLEVPDRAGNVAFHDVLEALGKTQFSEKDTELPPGVDGVKQITKAYAEVFKATELHKTVVSQYSSAYIFSVIRMQNAIRKKLAAKRKREAAGGNNFKEKSRQQLAASARQGGGGGGAPSSKRGPPSKRR